MPMHAVNRHLAFAPEQLFDLVADVEKYPEFVPWWVAATVVKKDGEGYHTRQVIGLPLVRQEFQTRTVLSRPGSIHVTSSDKPFRHLDMLWTFDQAPEGGSQVALRVSFEFQSMRYSMLASIISGDGVRRLVDAFQARALQVYGHAPHHRAEPASRAAVPEPVKALGGDEHRSGGNPLGGHPLGGHRLGHNHHRHVSPFRHGAAATAEA
ncbi:MAG: type II toxin-antitoxin system RatA family toxin [Alphaproteobacteria bacterium]